VFLKGLKKNIIIKTQKYRKSFVGVLIFISLKNNGLILIFQTIQMLIFHFVCILSKKSLYCTWIAL